MARKIVITSGKGGVGKTTVCCNLAVQLAKAGNRVIICDLDFGLNNVDVVLGTENLAIYDVLDAVEGRCRPRQALVRHPRYPTLYSLASNRVSERYVSPQAVRLVLDSLAPQFDYIFIDSPAGIEDGFHRAASCAEEALLVTTPHISAMRDADRVSGIL
ncbi:MAG: P-loop NTPase, partial [Clostridia bacterium]|nr:P-loop NTPase [Clostridia bacterium]